MNINPYPPASEPSKMVDVSTLRKQIKGTVLLPGDEGFEESLKRWAVNSEKKAGIVVFVTSAADVSIVVRFYLDTHDLTIRLNLPGKIESHLQLKQVVIQLPVPHRLMEDSSVCSSREYTNYIVDLSRMRGITVIPEKKIVIAQGGALISDLDQAAAEYGLATGILPLNFPLM
jgi:FAD binding domain